MEWKRYGMCEINGNAQVAIPQTETNYAHIDIIDDFMFAYVMQSPDLCIELLEYLFPGHKIQRVDYLAANEEPDITVVVENGVAKSYPVAQKTLAVAFGISAWISIWMTEILSIMLKCRPQGQDICQRGHVIMPDKWI